MKKLLALLLSGIITWSCGDKFDDSELWNDLNNLKNRIEKLEELCKELNTNISSLKTMIDALEQNDYITDITSIYKDGKEIGYTINFEKNSPITIYHGKDGTNGNNGENGEDGKDGNTPIINIKKDTDGFYYWTLNGTWLTDDAGNKIRANGIDGTDGNAGTNGSNGKDGITPKLKIEDGDWYISYNDGITWIYVGQATGDKGDSGSSFYKDVKITDDSVIFTLINNTQLILPKRTSLALFIGGNYTDANPIYMAPGGITQITYELTGATTRTTIEAIAQDGYKVVVKKEDYKKGTIEITAPENKACDSRIIFLASDGLGQVIMKTLKIAEGFFTLESDRNIVINSERQSISINVTSNANWYITTPELNTLYSSWLTNYQNGKISIAENTTGLPRTAEITVHSYIHGINPFIIMITQNPANEIKIANVEIPGTLSTLYSDSEVDLLVGLKINGSLNELDYAFLNSLPNLKALDLMNVRDSEIPSKFSISSLETVILPTNLTVIRDSLFWRTNLKNVVVPDGVTEIGNSAFRGNQGLGNKKVLTNFRFPASLKKIGDYAFFYCQIPKNLPFPEELTDIGDYAFYNSVLSADNYIKIPNKVKKIGDYAFAYAGISTGQLIIEGAPSTKLGKYAFEMCTGLTYSVLISDNIIEIEEGAFKNCTRISILEIGKNVKMIGPHALANTCIKKLYCYGESLPLLGKEVFLNAEKNCLVVPAGSGRWPGFSEYEEF